MIRLITLGLALIAAAQSPCFGQVIAIRAGRVLDPATGSASLNQIILIQRGRIGAIGPNVTIPAGATVYDLSNAGLIPGPRVFAAGIWVGRKNGVCEFGGIGIAGGADAFRRRVRENIEAGADFIKVCVTGWPAEAYAHPDAYELPDSVLKAVVDAAHAGKRRVLAHDISRGGVRAGVAAGIDGLAHAAFLDSATAVLLRTRSIFMIPTLASLTAGSPRAASNELAWAVGLAQRVGVRLVFGTDGGVLPHGQNAKEFVAMYQAGVPLADLLRSATSNAARALGLDSLGQIGPGMVADIVALAEDPRGDVTAYQKVRFVMSRGQVVVARP